MLWKIYIILQCSVICIAAVSLGLPAKQDDSSNEPKETTTTPSPLTKTVPVHDILVETKSTSSVEPKTPWLLPKEPTAPAPPRLPSQNTNQRFNPSQYPAPNFAPNSNIPYESPFFENRDNTAEYFRARHESAIQEVQARAEAARRRHENAIQESRGLAEAARRRHEFDAQQAEARFEAARRLQLSNAGGANIPGPLYQPPFPMHPLQTQTHTQGWSIDSDSGFQQFSDNAPFGLQSGIPFGSSPNGLFDDVSGGPSFGRSRGFNNGF